jgi:hypothetical protein
VLNCLTARVHHHLDAMTLCERAVDRNPGDAETLRDRGGTQLGPQLPDLRRVGL